MNVGVKNNTLSTIMILVAVLAASWITLYLYEKQRKAKMNIGNVSCIPNSEICVGIDIKHMPNKNLVERRCYISSVGKQDGRSGPFLDAEINCQNGYGIYSYRWDNYLSQIKTDHGVITAISVYPRHTIDP
jgi:hypothetical protein